MKKIILGTVLGLSVFALAACGDDSPEKESETKVTQEETNSAETDTSSTKEVVVDKTEATNWESKVEEIVNSSDAASDKFYALEKLLMELDEETYDIAQFEKDIVADYKSGTYLNELTNDSRMLTNMFKAFMVEKQTQSPDMKDFAFDYYQNLKYTYRGVDTVDSEAVKSNESQMDKALANI